MRLVLSQRDFNKVKAGDVVVSPTAGPELVALLDHAGALVTDVGGTLCHLMLIAREAGVPAVVGVQHARNSLHDGDIVMVDADAGLVRRS